MKAGLNEQTSKRNGLLTSLRGLVEDIDVATLAALASLPTDELELVVNQLKDPRGAAAVVRRATGLAELDAKMGLPSERKAIRNDGTRLTCDVMTPEEARGFLAARDGRLASRNGN